MALPLAVEVSETEPHGAVGQETLQVTPLFAESLATVAVNCSVVPAGTAAAAGKSETEIGRVTAPLPPPPQPPSSMAIASVAASAAPRFREGISCGDTSLHSVISSPPDCCLDFLRPSSAVLRCPRYSHSPFDLSGSPLWTKSSSGTAGRVTVHRPERGHDARPCSSAPAKFPPPSRRLCFHL